ncbi:retinol dehydrogenase, putative [Talaromyces stipitatus ATCC 10500]|uniref:Retinol dehydrogenase, putative n=1 Tax=Talaromyces stipitatus (strain ATCC 10500 / CBS 375.48 / QM 6759 / NRRL 1006) TaxID=441959 RepID=B8MF52_TALSN|nr:retinol dehydrogenase, putative [Talaromyces stipitatus ATCC 10500]EED16151.1 retinol dehydrogenase, putative [Talaromyces stipitatus ATCC 10500]
MGEQNIVLITDVDQGIKAASSLSSLGSGNVSSLQLVVTSDESISSAKNTIEDKYGRLDVLVNNAGITLDVKEKGTPIRSLMQRTFEVNVFGAAAVTEAFIPLLEKSSNPRIVFTSSSVGSLTRASDLTNPWSKTPITTYRTSKPALNMLMLSYAALLHEKGFKVNASCPGYIGTNLNDHRGTGSIDDGAVSLARPVTLRKDGETGTFSTAEEVRPW